MIHSILRNAALLFVVAVATCPVASPTLARGGGSEFMNSPGYQRALTDSRKRLSQPAAQPEPGVGVRKAPRHRRHVRRR